MRARRGRNQDSRRDRRGDRDQPGMRFPLFRSDLGREFGQDQGGNMDLAPRFRDAGRTQTVRRDQLAQECWAAGGRRPTHRRLFE